MKKIIIMALLVGLCVMNVGCGTLSYYNHTRVKESIVQTRIMASGNQEAIKAVRMGAKPSQAVQFIPLGNNGVVMAVDLADLQGVSSFITTFAEAPISSSVALAVDGATTYYSVKYIADTRFNNDSSSSQSDKSTTGNENNDISLDNVNVSGNLEINVNSENTYPPAE